MTERPPQSKTYPSKVYGRRRASNPMRTYVASMVLPVNMDLTAQQA